MAIWKWEYSISFAVTDVCSVFLKSPLTRKYSKVKPEYIFKSACWLHNSPPQLQTSFCYYKRVHRALQTLSPLLTAKETLSVSFWLFLQPSKYLCFLMHSNWVILVLLGRLSAPFYRKMGEAQSTRWHCSHTSDRSFPLICITVRKMPNLPFQGNSPRLHLAPAIWDRGIAPRSETWVISAQQKWFLPQLGRFFAFWGNFSPWNIKHSHSRSARSNDINLRARWAGKMLPLWIRKKNCYIQAINPEDSSCQKGFVGELLGGFSFYKATLGVFPN